MQAGQNIVVGQVEIFHECNEGDIIVYNINDKFMPLQWALEKKKDISQCTGVAMAKKSLQTANFVPVCVRGAIDATIPADVYEEDDIVPGKWLKVKSDKHNVSLLQIVGKILLPSIRGSKRAKPNAARVYVGPRTNYNKTSAGDTHVITATIAANDSNAVVTQTAVPFSPPVARIQIDAVMPAVQKASKIIALHPASTTTNFDAMLVSPNVATTLSKKAKKLKKSKK